MGPRPERIRGPGAGRFSVRSTRRSPDSGRYARTNIRMTHTVEIEINGLRMAIETGKVAKQADGAVVVRYGGSIGPAERGAAKRPKETQGFFPLAPEYRAAGHRGGRTPRRSFA